MTEPNETVQTTDTTNPTQEEPSQSTTPLQEQEETVDLTSILKTVRKLVGYHEAYADFDADLIFYINSAFFTLNQYGVGPTTPFVVTGTEEEWTDFVEGTDLEMVKIYVPLSVRLDFDPPTNSALLAAMQERKKEMEWRLNYAVEYGGNES